MAHELVVRGGTVVDGTGRAGSARPTSRSTATASPRSATSTATRRPHDRRRGQAGHARLRRHPHAISTPRSPGIARVVVVLARRHVGGGRQLRRHVRAVRARADHDYAGQTDGVGRGHPGPQHHVRPAAGTGRPTASTSTRSTACPRASTSAAWSATARCATTPWASAASTRRARRAPTTSPRWRDLVDEAMAAGALGFSTSRTLLHRVPDGRPVPGTFAQPDELLAFADVLGERGRGVFEAAALRRPTAPSTKRPSRGGLDGRGRRRSGRPLTFGLFQTHARPELYRRSSALSTPRTPPAARSGRRPPPRGIGVLFGSRTARLRPHPGVAGARGARPRRAARRARRPDRARRADRRRGERPTRRRTRQPLRAARPTIADYGPTRTTSLAAIAAAAA